jgi:hypothetical protein
MARYWGDDLKEVIKIIEELTKAVMEKIVSIPVNNPKKASD